MPITTIAVASVTDRPVRSTHLWDQRKLVKYDVQAAMEPGQGFAPLYETFDPLKASLCLRAKQTGSRVTIGWRETKYGRDIITVEIQEQVSA